MEVAVDHSVGQAAFSQQREPVQQPARGRRLAGAQLAGDRAVEQGADLRGEDRRAPVGQSGGAGELPGHESLSGGQALDGAGDDRR
jgi:hypothetical protein